MLNPMRECPHRFDTATKHFCSCAKFCERVPPIEPLKARADAEARYDVMPIDVREWLRENEKRWDAAQAVEDGK